MSTGTSTGSGAGPADPGNPYNINIGNPTSPSNATGDVSITINGRTYYINVASGLEPTQSVMGSRQTTGMPVARGRARAFEETPIGVIADVQGTGQTVAEKIQDIQSWYGNATKRAQIVQQLYAAGLVTSKKSPSAAEVINAWALVVQEAALENKAGVSISPEDLLAKASKTGWNSLSATLTPDATGSAGTGNLNNAADASTTTSQTIYKSYLDPATIMGAQADAWFRLMGRNPTQAEYKSFLDSVFQYQDASNTGKFESQTKDPSDKLTGSSADQIAGMDQAQTDPATQTSIVSQRGIGQRGLQFLAGQAALANPEEGAYQAATTYFNAFIKALSGPASGMQASGPTSTVP